MESKSQKITLFPELYEEIAHHLDLKTLINICNDR